MTDIGSSPFPPRLNLRPHEIHVIRIGLDQPVTGALQLMDAEERKRAARFVTERDRRRFVAAHAALRITLGRALGCAPAALRFAPGTHGKPRLVDPPVDLRFNLSHAGELALLALALGEEVGVDIEKERPIEVHQLARRFFAAVEAAALQAVPAAERTSAFFRCWTRKEAFIKALGDGLMFPLDAFDVSLTTEPSHQLLQSCRLPGVVGRWRIVALPIDRGYVAALAATAGDWRVVRWEAPREADGTTPP